MKNWFNRFMLKLAARTLERNGLTAVKLVVIGYKDWLHIDGFSESVVDYIKTYEANQA